MSGARNKGLTKSQIDKKKRGLCISHCCSNQRIGNYCSKCKKRKQSKMHPIKTSYYNLRTNAKRRGKPFDLTLDEFREFATATDYINKKGKTAQSYSIDRIKAHLGYIPGNIQVLTISENGIKGNKEKYDDLPF